MRAFAVLLAGTATQRRDYNRFNASTLQLFNLGLPFRAEVRRVGEAWVSECPGGSGSGAVAVVG